jgi:hypothetical protein
MAARSAAEQPDTSVHPVRHAPEEHEQERGQALSMQQVCPPAAPAQAVTRVPVL